MKLPLCIVLGSLALAVPSLAQSTQPTTQPNERYRLVSERDEVVAVLNNGITVIAKRVPSPAMAVRAYVKTGGVYEGQWLGAGLSHLLEHLVAGGSTEKRTEAENREILQQIGNNSNAYTTDNHTAYFINTTPPHLEKAVDLLAGYLFGAKITPEEYAREYQVVQRELEMGKGEPDRQFYHLFQLNRYQVSPARVPVIGYQSVIQGLKRDDVYAYFKLAYQPQNIVFSIAGDVDPNTIVAMVDRYTASQQPGREFSQDIPSEPAVLSPRSVVATAPQLGQAKLSLAFPSMRLDDPDLYALDLLASCLSDGDSALLVRSLRDEQQLVSSIGAYNATPDYVEGSFVVSAEMDVDKIKPATEAVLAHLEQVKKEGVPAETLTRAKTQMKVGRLRGIQTAEAIASTLARDYLSTSDPHFTDRYLEKIEQVTNEQIKTVAAKYLDPQRLLTTTLLPAEAAPQGLPSAVELLRTAATTQPTTTDAAAAATDAVTKKVLPDGTVLLTKRIATSPIVSIRAYTVGGVSIEDETTNGLGNLTMRMLPRGTKTRSAAQIAEFFDSVGAELNTTGGNNTFSWQAECLKDDLPKVAEVFADIINNPAFDEKELAAMKSRIGAAIYSQDSDWSSQAFRVFKEKYYGPLKSPYQFTAIGTRQNLDGFDAEMVRDWYEKFAMNGPRVLAIFGDVSAEEAEALATKFLLRAEQQQEERPHSDDAKGNEPAPLKAEVVLENVKPFIEVKGVEVQQTQQPLAGVVIGFDSDSYVGMPNAPAIDVADTMASGWGYPTGYLHEALRGRGLVYVVHGMTMPGRSPQLPGSWVVYAGCDPKNVDEVVDQILLNIARLQGDEKALGEGWMDRAKQLMLIDEAMSKQTAADQAESAALDELYGLGFAWSEKFTERVNEVTADKMQRVARRLLSRCVVTVCTPSPDAIKTTVAGKREYDTFPAMDLTPQGVQHDAGQ